MVLTLEWLLFYRQGAYLFFLEDPYKYYATIVGASGKRASAKFNLLVGTDDDLARVRDAGVRQPPSDLVKFELPRYRVTLPWIYTEAEALACLRISPLRRKVRLETPPELSGRVVVRYSSRLNPNLEAKFRPCGTKRPNLDVSGMARLPTGVTMAFSAQRDGTVRPVYGVSSF